MLKKLFKTVIFLGVAGVVMLGAVAFVINPSSLTDDRAQAKELADARQRVWEEASRFWDAVRN